MTYLILLVHIIQWFLQNFPSLAWGDLEVGDFPKDLIGKAYSAGVYASGLPKEYGVLIAFGGRWVSRGVIEGVVCCLIFFL